MSNKKLFCFGYGYTCDYLGHELTQRGDWLISGTTRDTDKRKALKERAIKAYIFDATAPLADPASILEGTTHLLISTPPGDDGDPVFEAHAADILRIKSLQWVGYLSTTGVYGDRDGEWVDETAEIRPTTKRGSRRARAEEQWLSLLHSHGLPVHIFRLAGIYGPGRSALDSIRAGVARRIDKPGHAFSRIHVEDIVQVLCASMDRPNPGAAYNISDDLAAPSHEVIKYACELLKRPIPKLVPFEQVDMSPMVLSFYGDNKRIHNERIKSELGVELKYKNYRAGLEACLAAEQYAISLFKTKNRLF
ncbi:MAG: SDR family oxidoreductase [Alphaproteobacteria bacterium]|nr:SDR family oxidoreductase [Alphaproteobacteria bacterium]